MTKRLKHDAYYTPEWMTRCLLHHVNIVGEVVEPCVGDGAISRVLQTHPAVCVRMDQ